MKKILFSLITIVALMSCSCKSQKDYKDICKQQEQLINQYEAMLDTIYAIDSSLMLDVVMEMDVYYDYTVLYNDYKASK